MLLAEENGKRLSRDQVVVTTMTFLVAGFESTNNLFTNLTHALAIHPDVYQQLKNDLTLIEPFVEEGMRYDAAAQGFVRSPSRAVELHGKIIPKNAQVLLHIGSANRDERQFDNPDTFDIFRDTKRHLGMGQGVHFCVGAPLGRDMSYTLFSELLNASDVWKIDLDNAQRVTTPNFRGFSRLPLTIGRSSS
jgi:cytochrome P450